VFLDTVEPAKSVMAPPSQPRRQSLAATHSAKGLTAQHNIAKIRLQALSQAQPGSSSSSQLSQQIPPSQPSGASQDKHASRKGSQYRDFIAGAEAKANEQARILQRQQAKAQQLDMQDRMANATTNGIGIDRESVERQKQFQSDASQRSRTMSMHQWAQTPQYPAYQNAFSGQSRPQQPGFEHNWVTQISPHLRPGSSHQMTAAPQFSQFPAYPQQTPNHFAYGPSHQRSVSMGTHTDSERLRFETARIESIRAAANQPPPPPPSAAVERQRRISNPAYPFKSPDQIKAQKEAEKNSPPGSRPGSSYQMASPVTTADTFRPTSSSSMHGPDPQYPPQFINPNATQISPPGSSAGRRSASNSISMPPGVMGPPMQPNAQRTVSAGMLERPNFMVPNSNGSTGGYVPRRSVFDPMYKQSGPQPIAQPNLPPPSPQPPMAEANPSLLAGLLSRPVSPSGYPINDKAIPPQLSSWQQEFGPKGGFWGKIANYYIKKHEASASVYRSPFAPKPDTSAPGLAEAYYNSLGQDGRNMIDEHKRNLART
jgi:hypothetical protein